MTSALELELAGAEGATSLRFRYEQRSIGNGLIRDMTEAVLSCSIQLDNNRAVPRTATFSLDASALPPSPINYGGSDTEFENGVDGWYALAGATVSRDTLWHHNFAGALKIVAAAQFDGAQKDVIVPASTYVTASVWVYSVGGTHAYVDLTDNLGNTLTGADFTIPADTWTQVWVSGITSANVNHRMRYYANVAGASTVWMDTVVIEKGDVGSNALMTAFSPPNAYIAVWMDVLVSGSYQSFQLGLFKCSLPKRSFSSASEIWSIDASDLTIELINQTLRNPYTVVAGTQYIQAVRNILINLGLQNNFSFTSDITPVAFTWPPGKTWYDVVSDLLNGINWFPPWPSASGVFTSRERVDPSTVTPDVSYYTNQEPRMAVVPYTQSEDRTHQPNRVVVVTQDPARSPVEVSRDNQDPTCVISIPTLGMTILKQITNDHIADATTAIEYADYELRNAMAKSFTAEFRTLLDPRRGAHETYQLFLEGVETGRLWQVNSWSMECKTGAVMTHQLGMASPGIAIWTNIIEDPGFEAGVSEWQTWQGTLTWYAGLSHSGSYSMKVAYYVPTAYSAYFVYNLTGPTAGRRFIGNAWIYATPDMAGKYLYVQIREAGGAQPQEDHSEIYLLVEGWQWVTSNGVITQNDRTSVQLIFERSYITFVGEYFYVDDTALYEEGV